jgi:multidrug efflux system outer membrane protein
MIAAEKKVIAAFHEEQAAHLALLPNFSLNLFGGRLADNLLSVLQLNPWMIAASFGLTVPIYSAGRIPAEIKITTIEQQIAVTNYGITALGAFKEVENGLTNETLLAQRYAIEKNVYDDRTAALRIARLKYDAGSIDLLPVLQLQQYQIESQLILVKLRFEQLANFINLQLYLGSTYN